MIRTKKRRIKLTVFILILISILVGGCEKKDDKDAGYKNNTSRVSLEAVKKATAHKKIIYVDINSNGNNDGSSWSNACNYLQDALAVAQSGQQIWVAKGTYRPDHGIGLSPGDKKASFNLRNGVVIYGGFESGDELEDRNPPANRTILSGDLKGDDVEITKLDYTLFERTRNDNSSHVVTGSGRDETSILDGVEITGGYTQMHSSGFGGGMFNSTGSPTLKNCTFSNNAAFFGGAAMYNEQNSNPTLTECAFIGNITSTSGGAIYSENSSPKLNKCTFNKNLAKESGGGVYSNNSNAIMIECIFTKNIADEGGGVYNNDSNAAVIDCTFKANSAHSGGGITNHGGNPSIVDCLFEGNLAQSRGAGMTNDTSNPTVADCNFTENLIVGPMGYGGGMFNKNSNPKIENSGFNKNRASSGGGISNMESNPAINNCLFGGNLTKGYPGSGGGMSNYGSSPTVSKCVFIANYASKYSGGGMLNRGGSSPVIIGSIFERNISEHEGGGLYNSYGSTPSLTDCEFTGNIAKSNGGGMYHAGKLHFKGGGTHNVESNPIIIRCVFSGNSAYSGGGMELVATSPTLINCVFVGNKANGKYGSGGAINNTFNSDIGSHPTLTNCIVWGNFGPGGTVKSAQIHYNQSSSTINYSCVQSPGGVLEGAGNTNIGPQFVDEGHWDGQPMNEGTWMNGDYHLKSQEGRWDPSSQTWVQDNVTSPCIDAGDPNISIGYEPSPNGSIINMGRYGGTHEASKSYSNQEP
jgi:predicted outer membrane repeat protein